MNHSKALLAVACCATISIVGCASKPSALDTFASSTARSNPISSEVAAENEDFVSTRYSKAVSEKSGEMGKLDQQLNSQVASVRIAACERLGAIAAQSEGYLEPIEMLASVMKSDDSMEVRMAATDALSSLSEVDKDQLSSMVPTEQLPEPSNVRVSFLDRIFR